MTYKAFTTEQVIKGFETIPIVSGQLDLNGLCNAKCWYCPVKYEGNPEEFKTNTSVQDLEIILSKLRSSKRLVENFQYIYTCHYNEILLYPYFEEMLQLFRKYGFKTMILTNGTPLVKSKMDLILKYPDVVGGICLNIPDIDKEKWALKAGFSETVYNVLIKNLTYINEVYPSATIQVNTSLKPVKYLGIQNNDSENQRIVTQFRSLFPNLALAVLTGLSDRANRLSEHQVLWSNKTTRFNHQRPPVGCNHSDPNGGRIYSWFHINPKGDLFICCDDYDMKYNFGNLLVDDFDTIWTSTRHAEVVRQSQREMCINCASAV